MKSVKAEEQEKVFRALENRKYKWRTIRGIASESNLSPVKVEIVIRKNQDKIVRSSIPSQNGEILYTSRRHYKQTSSFSDRIKAAFKNRIA